jgi:hypothetical protein
MKSVSAEGKKKLSEMLKRVQHDNSVWFSFFVIPNLFRDLGFKNFGFKAPPCRRGSLLYHFSLLKNESQKPKKSRESL